MENKTEYKTETETKEVEMITKRTWEEFRSSGLLWLVNTMLHVFGWSLVFQFEGEKVIGVFPARVKFRGFSNDVNTNSYINLSEYMAKNADDLLKEARD